MQNISVPTSILNTLISDFMTTFNVHFIWAPTECSYNILILSWAEG